MGKNTIKIRTVLVANRGEIAVRIIKTVQAMGLYAVAVYSRTDANALHVTTADIAHYLGTSPQSYTEIDTLIDAAKKCGAQAIHPGYGFLSESAQFARACANAGIVFIGPSPESIEIMGDKSAAKIKMKARGIICVPGYEGEDQSDDAMGKAVEKIGYPVMVKAAHGGGGRGMRLVETPEGLASALQQARGEALSVFGSDRLILEKAVTNARHIEVQVFGDSHANIIHLGERDCSMQRRYQKIIEEAPAPALKDKLRKDMHQTAINVAQSVNYQGAGTVEFLLDADDSFYFLEMNTRLQVEHPVTELVTGIDLVEWQIRIARGEPLPLAQDEVKITGHAIEARLCAEDPQNDFIPSTGLIKKWQAAKNTRVDSGVVSGSEINPFYDSLVAKIICLGDTRGEAVSALRDALIQTTLFGPQHNKKFLLELLEQDAKNTRPATTQMISELLVRRKTERQTPTPQIICLAAVLAYSHRKKMSLNEAPQIARELANWSSSPMPAVHVVLWHDEAYFDVKLADALHGVSLAASFNGETFEFDELGDAGIETPVRNLQFSDWFCVEEEIYLSVAGEDFRFNLLPASAQEEAIADGFISAPMHGVLAQINVKTGEIVSTNTSLAVLEAMKMRHEILAGVEGKIKVVHHGDGAQVAAGELLFEIEKEAL